VAKDVPLPVASTCITLGLEPPNSGFNALQIALPAGVGNSCPSAGSTSWGAGPLSDAGGTWTASLSTAETYGVTFTFAASATPNEAVALCYQITDVDGSNPQGTITFTVTDTLQAVDQTINLFPLSGVQPPGSPSASYAIPFATLASHDNIHPAGAEVFLKLAGPPTAGTTSLGGTVTPASLGPAAVTSTSPFTYTPKVLANAQPFLTCDINGNDINTATSPCTYDTFAYLLQSMDRSSTSPTDATVSLNIQATTSFSRATNNAKNVYTILSSNCAAGCHLSSNEGAAGDPGYYWQLIPPQVTPPATSPTLAQVVAAMNATYQSITGNNRAGGCNDWTRCQISNETTHVSSSVGYTQQAALYYNVCDSTSTHYSLHFNLGAGTPACAVLSQWILEGGHND
jgi:hypothetical protein